jgi:hypothetical protein
MTIAGETVLAGAPHPGTPLKILKSPAGWYIGFTDDSGLPYSRETDYFQSRESAVLCYSVLRGVDK